MSLPRSLTAALAVLVVAGAEPARGQANVARVFMYGGGYSGLKDLGPGGTASFKLGFNIGGGVGVQLDSTLELQARAGGAQSQLRQGGAETGVYLNRYYAGADVKAGFRIAPSVRPYALFGGGVMKLHQKGTTGYDPLQGYVDMGAGVAYDVRKSGLSLFFQGDAMFYSLSQLTSGTLGSYGDTQRDLAWSGGVAYRVRL